MNFRGVKSSSLLVYFILVVTVALAPLSPARAAVIGSFGTFSGGGTRQVLSEVTFELYYGSISSPEVTIFSEALTADGVFTVSSGDDFNLATSRMTDGINSRLSALSAGTSGEERSEAGWLFGDNTGASGIDLAGFVIDRFI